MRSPVRDHASRTDVCFRPTCDRDCKSTSTQHVGRHACLLQDVLGHASGGADVKTHQPPLA
eukprot:4341689-Alexandrium_andersonii.AAC.1